MLRPVRIIDDTNLIFGNCHIYFEDIYNTGLSYSFINRISDDMISICSYNRTTEKFIVSTIGVIGTNLTGMGSVWYSTGISSLEVTTTCCEINENRFLHLYSEDSSWEKSYAMIVDLSKDIKVTTNGQIFGISKTDISSSKSGEVILF